MPTRHAYVESDATIVSLIASGQATTRSAIARLLGWASSTASIRVQALIDAGILTQTEIRTGTRGRPACRLTLTPHGGYVVAIEFGGRQVRLAAMSLTGQIEQRADLAIDLADGPTAILPKVAEQIEAMTAHLSRDSSLRGVGVAVPGPVDTSNGVITLPARMPGWSNFPIRDWLSDRLGAPVFADNDANLMAFGEHVIREDGPASTVTVKAGTGIGAGIIVEGSIYRGATYAAGDITHYKVADAGQTPCSCGNRGCLETIASGAALVEFMRQQGRDVATTGDIVNLAREGDPAVTTAVRAAGASLGQVLCAVVNFFNPHAVYLGGVLATVEPFVAAVRAQIYQGSHPLVTRNLAVERVRAGADGVLIGCGRLAIEQGLDTSTAAVNAQSGWK